MDRDWMPLSMIFHKLSVISNINKKNIINTSGVM